MRRLLRQLLNSRMVSPSPNGSGVPAEISLIDSYSMSGLQVLRKLYKLGRDIVYRDIPGDFVECGVCNGGSAAAIACAMRNTQRKAWLYDSFQGVPQPKEVDGAVAANFTGAWVGSEEKVREAMRLVAFPETSYIIRKGWFEDSFKSPLPEKVSLLHVDGDWYDSVMLALDTFYDLVPNGGIILLDDFAHWEGCREAFYDFIAGRHLKPLLERFGHTQAFWVKGRTHNRDFGGKWEIP